MSRPYEGKMPLKNDRQERFCQEYLVDLNATQAAKRAQYSEKTAYSIGQRLLKKVEIQRRIAHLKQDRTERTRVTADMVINELKIIALADLKNHFDIDESGQIRAKTFDEMGVNSRALQSIEEDRIIKEDAGGTEKITVHDKFKYRLHDKQRALKMLANHMGLNVDQSNVNIKGGVNIRPQADLSMSRLIKSFKKLDDNGDK